jgi:hypothetical protein
LVLNVAPTYPCCPRRRAGVRTSVEHASYCRLRLDAASRDLLNPLEVVREIQYFADPFEALPTPLVALCPIVTLRLQGFRLQILAMILVFVLIKALSA